MGVQQNPRQTVTLLTSLEADQTSPFSRQDKMAGLVYAGCLLVFLMVSAQVSAGFMPHGHFPFMGARFFQPHLFKKIFLHKLGKYKVESPQPKPASRPFTLADIPSSNPPNDYRPENHVDSNNFGGLDSNNFGGLDPNSIGGLDPNSIGGLDPNSIGGLDPNSIGGLDPLGFGGLDYMGGVPDYGVVDVAAAAAATNDLNGAGLGLLDTGFGSEISDSTVIINNGPAAKGGGYPGSGVAVQGGAM